MLKIISQYQRLNKRIPECEPLALFVTRRNVRTQVVDEDARSFRTTVEVKTINRAEEMRPYRVSDFSLDNLISLGAKMSPTHLSASPHKSVTDMVATLDSINPEND